MNKHKLHLTIKPIAISDHYADHTILAQQAIDRITCEWHKIHYDHECETCGLSKDKEE